MLLVMKNKDEILSQLTQKDLWPPNIGFNFHNPGGFMSFCEYSSYDKKISNIAKEFFETHSKDE
jgi:hypothetical protein